MARLILLHPLQNSSTAQLRQGYGCATAQAHISRDAATVLSGEKCVAPFPPSIFVSSHSDWEECVDT